MPLSAAVLEESEFIDPRIVDRHPSFAASIAYAARTCVPGQQSIRSALWTKIRPWMHAPPFSDRESDKTELISLKFLLVLYASAKSSILGKGRHYPEHQLHLCTVKSQAEMYSRHIRLHQSARHFAEAGHDSPANADLLREYRCWLWLHASCH